MKIFRNDEVLWREEDEPKAQAYDGLSKGQDVEDMGTSVLFSDGTMLSLNILGTEIWKRCDGRSVDEIATDLLIEFDVDPDVLRKDVLAFLSELEQKGFIRYEE
ncbi:MAG: GeoRSP system PqqD family peptide chaperone [Thermodesulfovibrionales bacterium]|jgi:GeoRSP system PqqD family protein